MLFLRIVSGHFFIHVLSRSPFTRGGSLAGRLFRRAAALTRRIVLGSAPDVRRVETARRRRMARSRARCVAGWPADGKWRQTAADGVPDGSGANGVGTYRRGYVAAIHTREGQIVSV